MKNSVKLNKHLNDLLLTMFNNDRKDYVKAFIVCFYITHTRVNKKYEPFLAFSKGRRKKICNNIADLNPILQVLIDNGIINYIAPEENAKKDVKSLPNRIKFTKDVYNENYIDLSSTFDITELKKIFNVYKYNTNENTRDTDFIDLNDELNFSELDDKSKLYIQDIQLGANIVKRDPSGRLYTAFSKLKGEYRKYIVDTNTLNTFISIDGKNISHALLAYNISKTIKDISIKNISKIYDGTMYDHIAGLLSLERDEVKLVLNIIVNTVYHNVSHTNKNHSDIYYCFIEHYGDYLQGVKQFSYSLKDKHYKINGEEYSPLAFFLREAESKMMDKIITAYRKRFGKKANIFRIHDSINIPVKYTDEFMSIIKDIPELKTFSFKIEQFNLETPLYDIDEVVDYYFNNVTKTDDHIIFIHKTKRLSFKIKIGKNKTDEYIKNKIKNKLIKKLNSYSEYEEIVKNKKSIVEEVIATTQPEVKAVEVIEVPEATDNDFHIQDIFNTSKSAVVGAMLDIYNTPTIGVDTVNVEEHKEIKRVIVQRQRSYELPELTDDMKKICADRLNENKNKIPFREKEILVKDYCEKHGIFFDKDNYNYILDQYNEMLELGD